MESMLFCSLAISHALALKHMDFCPLRRRRLFSRVFIPIRILQWCANTPSLKPSSIFLVNTKPLTQHDKHYIFWEKAWINIKYQCQLGTTTTQKLTKLNGKGLTYVAVPGHFPLPLINWQITLFPTFNHPHANFAARKFWWMTSWHQQRHHCLVVLIQTESHSVLNGFHLHHHKYVTIPY